jgi:hypothetical protein
MHQVKQEIHLKSVRYHQRTETIYILCRQLLYPLFTYSSSLKCLKFQHIVKRCRETKGPLSESPLYIKEFWQRAILCNGWGNILIKDFYPFYHRLSKIKEFQCVINEWPRNRIKCFFKINK